MENPSSHWYVITVLGRYTANDCTNDPLPTRSGMGQLITEIIYWLKSNDFNFDIVNFPHLDSDIPATPRMQYIAQLLCYAWASSLYSDFSQRRCLLSTKLVVRDFYRIVSSCPSILWLAHRRLEMVLSIMFWFKDNHFVSLLSLPIAFFFYIELVIIHTTNFASWRINIWCINLSQLFVMVNILLTYEKKKKTCMTAPFH